MDGYLYFVIVLGNLKLSNCKDVDELLKNPSNLFQKNIMYRLLSLIQKKIWIKRARALVFVMGIKEYFQMASIMISFNYIKIDLEYLDKTLPLLKSNNYCVCVNSALHEYIRMVLTFIKIQIT